MPSDSKKHSYGFTLVELLVVMAFISILAGALFMVINPVQLQRKSRETVLKAKTSQICLALSSCVASKNDARECSSFDLLGVSDPTGDPPESSYLVVSKSDPVMPNSVIYVYGTYSVTGCSYGCSADFGTGEFGKFQQVGSHCL